MTWQISLNPNIWPPALTLLLLLALSFYAWYHRNVPGARWFIFGSLCSIFWISGALLESASINLDTKIFWVKFQGAWQLPAVTAITCFILEYTWPGRWLTRRNLALLAIPNLLMLALVLSNESSHLAWRGFEYVGRIIPVRGPANLALVAYAYGLGLLNIIVFIWLFRRSPQNRWPVVTMLIGLVGGHTLYALEAAHVIPSSVSFELPPIAIEFLAYAIALFGFHIFDPIPLANKTVTEQIPEGMLVLDSQGNVANLNKAAQTILGVAKKQALGRPVRELLPENYSTDLNLPPTGSKETELEIRSEESTRIYRLESSDLKDWRGLVIGSLVLLRDVTGQKQVQKHLLEQMWAQATLQEREQLAGELHDGLSQNLAFLNLQAQAAQVYLQSGQEKSAQASLERLIEAAGQIQEDTREMIDHLLTVSQPAENFCTILRKMLAGFEGQTGLAIHLEIDENLDGQNCSDPASLGPPAAVQLVRITQEALVNVRKHARDASQVDVALNRKDGHLVLSIKDNGQGFDPDACDPARKHFGLQVMRQRAARIGGQVEINSAFGRGTHIEVSVPLAIQERLP